MAVKFDKEMLIKHRFWVLLAASLPLVLVALFILITSVGAHIDSVRKKVADKHKELNSVKEAVGPSVIEQRGEVAKSRKEKETEVHAAAFKAQDWIATWPKKVEDHFDFQHGRFATDVKISTAPKDKESWPANADDLYHGVVTAADPDFVIIKNKEDKEVKFYPTLKVKVSKQDRKAEEKDLWETIGPGDFLAISYYRSKYFYDPLTVNEQILYKSSYDSQIDDILSIVDPVDAKGNGTVQFHGWLYKKGTPPPEHSKFFTFVAKPWNIEGFIFAEAWTAQEDLWIQRELFQRIRAANDAVAKLQFKPAKEEEGKPVPESRYQDKTKPITFANNNYELTFDWVDAQKLAITVKNNLNRRQKLDVYFKVKFNTQANSDLAFESILFPGEPLEPKGSKNGKDAMRKELPLDKGTIKRTGIYGVEQVLTWETAPIKRIDHLAIGSAADEIAHGHKTFPQGSQPYRKEEKKEEAGRGEGLGMAAGMMPGGAGGKGGVFGAAGGEGGGAAAAAKRGVNDVLLDRYLEVSEQSRRLPVGLSLIVDQDHINGVLTSFNNSNLRFLTTQVLLNRYPNSVRPPLVANASAGEAPKEAEGPPPAAFAPMGVFGEGPRGAGSGPKGGIGPMGPMGIFAPPGMAMGPGGLGIGGTANTGALSAGAEELENNVELVIYGIVTLYERYPKRKVEVK